MDFRTVYPAPLRVLSRLIDIMLAIGGLCILILTFGNATLRGFAGFDLAWSLEVTSFLLLWTTFLGCAAAIARGAHMRVTEITQAFLRSSSRQVEVAAKSGWEDWQCRSDAADGSDAWRGNRLLI